MTEPPERWGSWLGSQYQNYRYFNCDRGKITSATMRAARDGRGTWTFDTDHGFLMLYVTCPQCGRPNNISDHSYLISPSGRISDSCVVCPIIRCRIHFFPQLHGWRPSLKLKIGGRVPVRQKKEA